MASSPNIYIAEVGFATRFWSRLRAAFQVSYEENCFGIAKGAAYSSLLAFFPVITAIAAVLVQANADAVARTIARLLYDVMPPGTEDVVRALFTVKGRRPTMLLIGAVVTAVWAGSGVMMSLQEGFQAIYQIPGGRSFVKERAVAMWLVLTSAIPLLGASALIVFGNRTRRYLIEWLGLTRGDDDLRGWVTLGGQAISFAIALFAIVIVMALVYYFGPNRRQSFRGVFPGAILATVLWLISTLAVAWYLRDIANYNVLYGGVGAGLALLVWSYVLSVITLFGCAYNAVYERR
ncbi:MAG: YihY/virulence factor BrkB family protein [Acidobacteriota bacterium]|nr:YihY/virulence factor BrkB family protein [Acidobacteriota bacterium]